MSTSSAMTFLKNWKQGIFSIGNHHHYGIFLETLEERGNKLLEESNTFLRENVETISLQEQVEIKCWQFWLVGYLSGQKLIIKSENAVGTNILLPSTVPSNTV
jgi:hypothetical protein